MKTTIISYMFNAGLGVELVSSAHSKYNKAVKAHLND